MLAVLAGNDILCCSDYRMQYGTVLAAVNDGRISEDLIDEVVFRILTWKHELGLIA